MNSPHVNAWSFSPYQRGRPLELVSNSENSPGHGRPISPGPQTRELQRPISPGPQARTWRGGPISPPGALVFNAPLPLSPWKPLPQPGTWGFIQPKASGTPPPGAQVSEGPTAVPPPLSGDGQYVGSPAPMLSPSPSRALRSPSPSRVADNGRIPNGMSNGIFPKLGTTYGAPEYDLAEGIQLARGDAVDWIDKQLSDLMQKRELLLALNERQAERAEKQAYLKIPTQSRCLAPDGSHASSPSIPGNSSGMASLLQADHEALRHQVDQLRNQRFENELEREEMNLAFKVERQELDCAREQLESDIDGKMRQIKALSEGAEDGMRRSRQGRGVEEVAAAKINELEQKCEALRLELAAERQLAMEAIRDRQEAQKMHQDAENDLTAVKEISGQVLNDCRSLQQRVRDLQIGPEEKAGTNGYSGSSDSTIPAAWQPDRRKSKDEPQQPDSNALSPQRRSTSRQEELVADESVDVQRDLMSMHGRIKDLERELNMVHRKSQALSQSRRCSAPESPTQSSPSRDRIRTISMPALVGDMHSSLPEGFEGLLKYGNST